MSRLRWMPLPARKIEYARTAEACVFDLHEFAKALGLSYRQLERYSKSDLGCSPKTWLDKQRIAAAITMLQYQSSVKAVAIDLGFRSESHFCFFFRKYTGRSPGEVLRANARQRAA